MKLSAELSPTCSPKRALTALAAAAKAPDRPLANAFHELLQRKNIPYKVPNLMENALRILRSVPDENLGYTAGCILRAWWSSGPELLNPLRHVLIEAPQIRPDAHGTIVLRIEEENGQAALRCARAVESELGTLIWTIDGGKMSLSHFAGKLHRGA